MVCSVGNAKMAVMARLSYSGKFSQSVAERAGHQKLVAQYIQKELLEADDANLLEEEDMHVFDLNPLTDPLHLVCCNFCRKPVKASEFAIHAELCRSLGIAELFPELDSGTGNRKPQRKERRKSVTARKRVMSTGCQGTYSDADASENIASCFQMNERIKFTSSRLVEAKGYPGAIAGLSGEMIRLAKFSKLIAADTAQPSDDIQPAKGVSNITHFQDASTCKTRYICHVPAPLATKTYYSQRNNRLQAAISRMYRHASMKGCKNEMEWQGNFIISEAPTLEVFRERQFDDQVEQNSKITAREVFRERQFDDQVEQAMFHSEFGQCRRPSIKQLCESVSMIDTYTSLTAIT